MTTTLDYQTCGMCKWAKPPAKPPTREYRHLLYCTKRKALPRHNAATICPYYTPGAYSKKVQPR